ncbi:MerR family transcriptional regulator [Clostridiaceae bacterium M8S5]|nr:MerR family transcriptional regulator [Clostridiaceae bacterium M8S5]
MEYRIKDVAKLTNLSGYTIRYYENAGIIPPVKRDKNGVRIFTEENVFWLNLVTCLKRTKMPVNDIKKIVQLSQEGKHTIPERKEILKNHRKNIELQIEELEYSKNKIDQKIDFYNGNKKC